jgi:hypothetical protein
MACGETRSVSMTAPRNRYRSIGTSDGATAQLRDQASGPTLACELALLDDVVRSRVGRQAQRSTAHEGAMYVGAHAARRTVQHWRCRSAYSECTQ